MSKYEFALKDLGKFDTILPNQSTIILSELVERATLKKVIDDECPNCKSITATCEQDYSGDYIKYHDFCTNCGQALDWSDK